MSARQFVFVGGIHGVGKSTFSAEIANFLKIESFSAGKLIASHIDPPPSAKNVKDVAGNQHALLGALSQPCFLGKRFLLDGHFCVLDGSGSVQAIPLSVFAALAPRGVLVLQDDVLRIKDRLFQRDGRQYESTLLRNFQQAEVQQAWAVANALDVNMEVLSPDDLAAGQKFVEMNLQ